MRSILSTVILMTLATPVIAEEQQKNRYINLNLGYLQTENIDLGAVDAGGGVILDLGSIEAEGGLISVAVGQDYGMFRFEGELGYFYQDFDDIDTSVVTAPVPSEVEIEAWTVSAMVNAFLDIPIGAFDVYAGGGLGAAYTGVDVAVEVAGIEVASDNDGEVDFAWQGIGGARYNISDQWSVHGQYRYIDFDEFSQQSVEIGVGFAF